ncbi:DUF2971 domain-containing protein [Curtobacterium sp. L1-20]|uniref:DUF2971 domain-containing protein n=1 Tax=Curtobacterium sp. L1-20 TaxID=3138181 RepID=UPI003B51F3B7
MTFSGPAQASEWPHDGGTAPATFETISNGADDYLEDELNSSQRSLTSDLYHYTTADTALLHILAGRTIRLSPFSGTNDLWESRPLWPNLEGELDGDAFGIWSDIDRYIRLYSKVACFTQDWQLPQSVLNPDALRGWAHLSLWAHYGGRHAGVCLKFDRDKLIDAFGEARPSAIHHFYGPIKYRTAERGVGPHGVSLEQLGEFGVDAVSLRYAHLHQERLFFRKHVDWASEKEFRLVRTDLSTEPHHVDISSALTGVVLGDAFPQERLPELRQMLNGFGEVDIQQAKFHNRSFRLFPWEPLVTPSPSGTQIAGGLSPRRSGDLAARLRDLEDAERAAKEIEEHAKWVAEPVLGLWHEAFNRCSKALAVWPNVVLSVHPSGIAIPAKDRRRPPGVPGNSVAYEGGVMIVGEHQPQYTCTWVMAVALQVMRDGTGRLHACVTLEEWKDEGNSQQEIYRDRRDANPDRILGSATDLVFSLFEALPIAQRKFDEVRGAAR